MDSALSVVIPYCRRPELVQTIVEGLVPAVGEALFDIVVVECGPPDDATRSLLQNIPTKHSISWFMIDTPFNKSLAINVGVSETASDLLMLLDADVLVSRDFIDHALLTVADGRVCCLGEVTESLAPDRVRSAPGTIVLTRRDFIAVDGMNSNLKGWGFDDLDFLLRLRVGGVRIDRYGSGVHITHGDEVRDLLPGLTKWESDSLNRGRSHAGIIRGDIFGTYAQDVAEWGSGVVP